MIGRQGRVRREKNGREYKHENRSIPLCPLQNLVLSPPHGGMREGFREGQKSQHHSVSLMYPNQNRCASKQLWFGQGGQRTLGRSCYLFGWKTPLRSPESPRVFLGQRFRGCGLEKFRVVPDSLWIFLEQKHLSGGFVDREEAWASLSPSERI